MGSFFFVVSVCLHHDEQKLHSYCFSYLLSYSLGIHEFEVPKPSIRGRVKRKSLIVENVGSSAPYSIIDKELVTTVNDWLGQGISVTRDQGLEFANQLLKSKKVKKGDIVLDAKWWRSFLERNKRKLACADR